MVTTESVTTESEETLMEKLYRSAGLQEQLLASDEDRADDDQDVGESTVDPSDFDPMPIESPLDHTGPIPPEYRRDPYAVEVFPMPPENASSTSKPRLQIQERVLWASTIAVSWSITIVAVLKVLGIL